MQTNVVRSQQLALLVDTAYTLLLLMKQLIRWQVHPGIQNYISVIPHPGYILGYLLTPWFNSSPNRTLKFFFQ